LEGPSSGEIGHARRIAASGVAYVSDHCVDVQVTIRHRVKLIAVGTLQSNDGLPKLDHVLAVDLDVGVVLLPVTEQAVVARTIVSTAIKIHLS
jgi:hypothetical protein